MCGFAGFVDRSRSSAGEALARTAAAMAAPLVHRGPDDEGSWADPEAGLALGHRRLAIIDLSPTGRQPMTSGDGRYVIAYNGEVYNFRELRAELEALGHVFRGSSDTEVVVEGCARWGVREAVPRLAGMFAFALWDRRKRELTLVRDRLGIKPLYWGEAGGVLLFGSELKALRAHPRFAAEIDRDALASYLRHGYIPGPHSIYRGVSKLEPGHMLTWRADGGPRISCYWDLRAVAAAAALAEPRHVAEDEAVEALEALLRDTVRSHMVADVPLGVFLSGGIDSSLVTALMQAESGRPVKSFSIGLEQQDFDEAAFAKAVAHHLGTEHTELYLGPDEAMDLIPRLPEWYDEPFADSSQLPTALVSRLARRDVTVSLSGDGGDELFAGYAHYFYCARAWAKLALAPRPLRRAAAGALERLPPPLTRALGPVVSGVPGRQLARGRVRRLARALRSAGPDDLYRHVLSHWEAPERLVPGAVEHKGRLWDDGVGAEIPDFIQRMQYRDTAQYLPDDILTKVDRASMAFGLEARVPLLDHRVVEQAWRLPPSMKVRDGEGKWVLRRILGKYLPRHLFERPKMGFGVPIHAWLRGRLRDWGEDLLDERRLREEGFLDPDPIRRRWAEHLSGEADWAYALWDVLMFEAWRRHAAA